MITAFTCVLALPVVQDIEIGLLENRIFLKKDILVLSRKGGALQSLHNALVCQFGAIGYIS